MSELPVSPELPPLHPELNPQEDRRTRRRIERVLSGLVVFTVGARVEHCPYTLRPGYSTAAWSLLSQADRERIIREVITEQEISKALRRAAAEVRASNEPTPTAETAPAPAAATTPALALAADDNGDDTLAEPAPLGDSRSRHIIACIGCGQWLPTNSHKPKRAVCSQPERSSTRPQSSPELRALRSVLAQTPGAVSVPGPRRGRSRRRRAVCGRTH